MHHRSPGTGTVARPRMLETEEYEMNDTARQDMEKLSDKSLRIYAMQSGNKQAWETYERARWEAEMSHAVGVEREDPDYEGLLQQRDSIILTARATFIDALMVSFS